MVTKHQRLDGHDTKENEECRKNREEWKKIACHLQIEDVIYFRWMIGILLRDLFSAKQTKR